MRKEAGRKNCLLWIANSNIERIFEVASLAILFVIIIIPLFFNTNDLTNSEKKNMLSCMSLLNVLIFVIHAIVKKKLFNIKALVAYSCFLFLWPSLLFYNINPDMDAILNNIFTETYVYKGYLLSYISVSSLVLGILFYEMFHKKTNVLNSVNKYTYESELYILLLAVLSISSIAYFYKLYNYANLSLEYGYGTAGYFSNNRQGFEMPKIGNLFSWFFMPSVIYVALYSYCREKRKVFFFACSLIMLSVILNYIIGVRNAAVSSFLVLLLIINRFKRLRSATIIVFLLALFAANIIVGATRYEVMDSKRNIVGKISESYAEKRLLREYVFSGFSTYYYYEHERDIQEYFKPRDLLKNIINAIPLLHKIIDKEWIREPSAYFNESFAPSIFLMGGGFGFNVISEGLYYFGEMGVVAFLFAFLWLMLWIDKLYQSNKVYKIAISLILIPQLLFAPRNMLIGILPPLFLQVVPLFITKNIISNLRKLHIALSSQQIAERRP